MVGKAASPLICSSASPQHRRRGIVLRCSAYEGREGAFRPCPGRSYDGREGAFVARPTSAWQAPVKAGKAPSSPAQAEATTAVKAPSAPAWTEPTTAGKAPSAPARAGATTAVKAASSRAHIPEGGSTKLLPHWGCGAATGHEGAMMPFVKFRDTSPSPRSSPPC